MKSIKNTLQEILKYPSAVFGTIIVLILIVSAIIVMVKIPYKEAINLWRGSEQIVRKNPKTAPPKWYNWFRTEKLVESLDLQEGDDDVMVEERVTEGGTRIKTTTFTIDYGYNTFPQELTLFFTSEYSAKQPFVSLKWFTPDGREIKIANFAIGQNHTFPINQDAKLKKKLGDVYPVIGLFATPESAKSEKPITLQGEYKLEVESVVFEEGSSVQPELVMLGQVFGWAGTDHMRRDLVIPMLWGIPIALAFGLIAAVGTSVLTMMIAGVGTWYGGVIDGLIQRITEINLVLPFLSILIMVGTFYSRSIWLILGVTVLLSIFTGGIKSYRAIFMQVKESTFIEAAKAYGASDSRIIFRYLIPRIIPLLIPGLVLAVPSFVFLEASLAVLGLGDPVLPTWGKMINDAYENAALYRGWYYWILQPAFLLMLTGLGFASLGFALDRIFNPRLRGM